MREDNGQSNFMSMSDDEDEGEEADDLMSVLNEEEGLVIPPSDDATSTKRGRSPGPEAQKEQVGVGIGRRESEGGKRSRRGTLESFFAPLTNFIDFKEDADGSRGWRSFVEIAS